MSVTETTSREDEDGGFPTGNTIAVVGDPGTGKTTFLLAFYAQSQIKGNRVVDGGNKKE